MKRDRCWFTQAELKQFLTYDHLTGEFVWKERRRGNARAIPGTRAGSLVSNGYLVVSVLGGRYSLHRLAWFYVHGTWPEMVDHLNGIKTDNRIENLRASNASANQHNRTIHRQGRLQGTFLNHGRWAAQVRENGQRRHLGNFDSMEQAHQAWLEAVAKRTSA